MATLNVYAALAGQKLLMSSCPTGLLEQLLVLVLGHLLVPPLTHRAHRSHLSYTPTLFRLRGRQTNCNMSDGSSTSIPSNDALGGNHTSSKIATANNYYPPYNITNASDNKSLGIKMTIRTCQHQRHHITKCRLGGISAPYPRHTAVLNGPGLTLQPVAYPKAATL